MNSNNAVIFHAGKSSDANNEVDITDFEGINAISELPEAKQIEGSVRVDRSVRVDQSSPGYLSPRFEYETFLFYLNSHPFATLYNIILFIVFHFGGCAYVSTFQGNGADDVCGSPSCKILVTCIRIV